MTANFTEEFAIVGRTPGPLAERPRRPPFLVWMARQNQGGPASAPDSTQSF